MEFKNKLPEGVGRKIVDALKKQSEIEVNSSDAEENNFFDEDFDMNDQQEDSYNENAEEYAFEEENNNYYQLENQEFGFEEEPVASTQMQEEHVSAQEAPFELYMPQQQTSQAQFITKPKAKQAQPRFEQPRFEQPRFEQHNYEIPQQVPYAASDFNQADWEGMDVPANIEVLKRLIAQLPAGVTRQTGAQIIRQTMEAMGISMNSVLSEAQQVQEDLGKSAKDCLNTIEEYKNNIKILERKVQTYKKQADQLGDLINLFIMTDKKR